MEKNKTKCKNCKKVKIRIFHGKFPNGKDKKWIGEDGLLWNGSLCGKCNQLRSFTTMRAIRAK